VVTGLVYGTALLALMALSARSLGTWSTKRMHHLTLSLIPIAGVGVFLGLSATTVSLLRAEQVPLWWVPGLRLGLLGIANVWSAWLAWRVTKRHAASVGPRLLSMVWFIAALAVADSAWYLMFYGFTRN
jgi:hypothetical protein